MRTVEFDLVSTLLVSMVVLFLGRFLVAWVPVLRRYLPAGSAQGAKISKLSGLRGITIPVHPAVSRYFGASAPAGPGAPGAPPKARRPRALRRRASAGA